MGEPTLNQSSGIDEGGAFWKSYNKMFRDQMVTNQNEDSPWLNHPGNKHSARTNRRLTTEFSPDDFYKELEQIHFLLTL
tara:strand:- start:3476 stop:3712 length:237 start_codon:yes stop_codon:yes gene_type:complete